MIDKKYETYQAFCREAVDTPLWNVFRQVPRYTYVLEHVSPEQGKAYLAEVHPRYLTPDLLEVWRASDSVGSPLLAEFEGIGKFSPTTIRYLKQLSDIEGLFGRDTFSSVVEVGGGYGGLARVLLNRMQGIQRYNLVDLLEANCVAEKFLASFPETDGRVVHQDTAARPSGTADLFISNYALAELEPYYRDHYLDVALKCPRGYVAVNAAQQVVAEKLAPLRPQMFPEPPLISQQGNFFTLVWGHDASAR